MNSTSLSRHAGRRFGLPGALSLLGLLAVSTAAAPSSAMPGFYVGKDSAKRTAHSSQVAIMNKDGRSVVTLLADYDGPMKPFAFVVPVPGDVTADRIKTLRRDAIGRLDEMSAPRFHEFWEKDPCEPGKADQIWERNLKASDSTNFLGINMPGTGPKKKVAKELSLKVKPDFKQGEYTFKLLSADDSAKLPSWLTDNGYKPPDGLEAAIKPYVDSGMKFLVADVDSKRLEIIAGGRSQLSAIRYWSEKPVTQIPSTLGRLNLSGTQELLVFVLDPEKRYETKNYKMVEPPTNLEVAMKSVPGPGGLKERPGELYAGIHDRLLAKDPKAFLLEYAWPTSGCGEPCPNPPLYISELLTLGADVFEQFVSDEDKNPDPPELSEEEKKKEEKLEKAEQKQAKETREEVARRKALLSRHEYILTRMHHRYTKDTLPEDVKIGPAAKHKRGGVEIPKGKEAKTAHRRHRFGSQQAAGSLQLLPSVEGPGEVREGDPTPLGQAAAKLPRSPQDLDRDRPIAKGPQRSPARQGDQDSCSGDRHQRGNRRPTGEAARAEERRKEGVWMPRCRWADG